MTRTSRILAAGLALLLTCGGCAAGAQTQPAPAARTTGGVVTTTPSSIFIAPAGGGPGLGKVVADDYPLPTTATLGPTSQSTLDQILTALTTPATALPPTPPVASTDATLTRVIFNVTTATDTTIVSATASQSTRVHRLYCSILPTAAVTVITFKSASTAISATFTFPAAGGFINWAYSPYWHLKTANNEALVMTTSQAGNFNCIADYVKGV